MSNAARHEPEPKKSNGREITPLVVADMIARAEAGKEKYGVALQAGNGRDALMDAYQEALDQAVYLRQLIEEIDTGERKVEAKRLVTFEELNGVLQKIRWGTGLSQEAVADLCRITRSAVANFETGRRLTFESARQIANALGYDLLCYLEKKK